MDKERKIQFSENFYLKITVILMIVYAAIGLFLYDDYGCGPDEGIERQTALVNFKYVIQKLKIPIDEENTNWLSYLPDLPEYRDRYYGTALHFPLVLLEFFSHFSFDAAKIYNIRHLYTFINYYLGLICLYLLVSNRFGSRKYGLIGLLLMISFPRFFAESFYNNKDIIFTAWYIICSYFIDRWFTKRDFKTSLLLAVSLAFTINTRFNGIIFIPIFIFLYIFDSFRSKKTNNLAFFIITLSAAVFFFYLMTPNFWEHPIRTAYETLQFNMRHPNHNSSGNLYKGVLVDAAHTITFIPTWIALTVPTVYLFFMLLGSVWYIAELFGNAATVKLNHISLADGLMFISSYCAVIFIILTHVTIYNGWRHCYFAYPGFVYFAVYFFEKTDHSNKRIIVNLAWSLLFISIFYNIFWITKNHPFEYVYFAPAARNSAGQYSGDYWSISSRALLEYITKNDLFYITKVNHLHSQAGSINRGLLPEEKQKFIELTYDEGPEVVYYIICRDEIPTVDIVPYGYEKVYSIIVDDNEIGAVFKNLFFTLVEEEIYNIAE